MYVHIRDNLSVSRQDMRQGKVSTRTLCGQDDPMMNRLAYGDPQLVERNQIKDACQKCKRIWKNESQSIRDQARAMHNFRKLIGANNNLQRLRNPGKRR